MYVHSFGKIIQLFFPNQSSFDGAVCRHVLDDNDDDNGDVSSLQTCEFFFLMANLHHFFYTLGMTLKKLFLYFAISLPKIS